MPFLTICNMSTAHEGIYFDKWKFVYRKKKEFLSIDYSREASQNYTYKNWKSDVSHMFVNEKSIELQNQQSYMYDRLTDNKYLISYSSLMKHLRIWNLFYLFDFLNTATSIWHYIMFQDTRKCVQVTSHAELFEI